MIVAAAAAHRVLFKLPPARRRFASIEDLRRCARNGAHKLARQGGDPGKALDEIQRDTFCRQNCARGTLHTQQRLTLAGRLPVTEEPFDANVARELAESR